MSEDEKQQLTRIIQQGVHNYGNLKVSERFLEKVFKESWTGQLTPEQEEAAKGVREELIKLNEAGLHGALAEDFYLQADNRDAALQAFHTLRESTDEAPISSKVRALMIADGLNEKQLPYALHLIKSGHPLDDVVNATRQVCSIGDGASIAAEVYNMLSGAGIKPETALDSAQEIELYCNGDTENFMQEFVANKDALIYVPENALDLTMLLSGFHEKVDKISEYPERPYEKFHALDYHPPDLGNEFDGAEFLPITDKPFLIGDGSITLTAHLAQKTEFPTAYNARKIMQIMMTKEKEGKMPTFDEAVDFYFQADPANTEQYVQTFVTMVTEEDASIVHAMKKTIALSQQNDESYSNGSKEVINGLEIYRRLREDGASAIDAYEHVQTIVESYGGLKAYDSFRKQGMSVEDAVKEAEDYCGWGFEL